MAVIKEQTLRVGRQVILYDAEALSAVPQTALPYLFEPAHIQQKGWLQRIAQGRGETWFYRWQESDLELVLRHYRRGGFVGKFNPDLYWGLRVENSRPWREWRLLCQLAEWGLPAPVPAAVRFLNSPLFYRADLLTHQIRDVEPLGDVLQERELASERWAQLGVLIAQFHRRGVYHDDLNAQNILLGSERDYLIDFDKGELRSPCAVARSANGKGWAGENLQRLKRSLHKIESRSEIFYFSASNWLSLLDGYRGG